ncbi:MAG: TrkA family potassium uptake protein [bacterium]|jgi:trk system potassium uptake protein TrkA
MKSVKFCVIGLGRFGYQTAVSLAQNGMEVLAIDENQSTVELIRNQVTQAVCYRIEDESALHALGVDEMDTVIVAMGENFAHAIVITALLKKRLKIPFVVARARNRVHEDILKLIGADKIIMPERDSGVRLANSLSLRFNDFVSVTEEFAITQISAPEAFIGKTVAELQLRKSRSVSCIAIKKDKTEEFILVGPEYLIVEGDVLVVCGSNKDLGQLRDW